MKKQEPQHMSVMIGLCNGVSAGLTKDNELMINCSEDGSTKVLNQISLGKITKYQLDAICQYLQRLRTHLPD